MTLAEFQEALIIPEQNGDVGKINELHRAFFSQKITYDLIADLFDDADDVLMHEESIDEIAKVIYNFQLYGNPDNWNFDNWETEKTKYYSGKIYE